jgi:hypothetical protein
MKGGSICEGSAGRPYGGDYGLVCKNVAEGFKDDQKEV